MLTYLVQVTESLLVVAVLSGFAFAFARYAWKPSGRRVLLAGCVVGWITALTLACLRNQTKLIDSGLWNIITETGEYQIGKVRVIYSAANPMLGNIEAKLYFSPPRRRIPFAGEILGQTAAEYGSKDELLNALNRVEGRDAFIDTVRKKLKALLPGKTEFEPMEYEFNMWRLDNDAYGLKFEDYINFYTWGWSLILERSGLSKHIEKANESRV